MDLTKKLQLSDDQVLEGLGDVPASLVAALPWQRVEHQEEGAGLLVFVGDRADLERRRAAIEGSASADRLTWVAYPKAGQLGTDLKRDSLAAALAEGGLQPVRQISIDEVWSALRFRPG